MENLFLVAADTPKNGWMTWVLMGVLLVGMFVMLALQGRRQKKANDDYMAMLDTLRPGVKVKMASGLLGRIKEIREEAPGFRVVILETGDAKNPHYMTFVLEAVQGIVNEEAINQLKLQQAVTEANKKEEKPAEEVPAQQEVTETKINGESVAADAKAKTTKKKAKSNK